MGVHLPTPLLKKKKLKEECIVLCFPCGKGALSGDTKPQTVRLGDLFICRSQSIWTEPDWMAAPVYSWMRSVLRFEATPCERNNSLNPESGRRPERGFKTKGWDGRRKRNTRAIFGVVHDPSKVWNFIQILYAKQFV